MEICSPIGGGSGRPHVLRALWCGSVLHHSLFFLILLLDFCFFSPPIFLHALQDQQLQQRIFKHSTFEIRKTDFSGTFNTSPCKMHSYICVYEHAGKKNSRKRIYGVLKPNLFEATELGAKPVQDEALLRCTPQLGSAWVLGMFSGCLCFNPRFQPAAGLMERIQAIAQNVSDIAIKVDQILRNSLMSAKSKCPVHSWALTRYAGAIGRSCHGELGKNIGWMLI